MLLAYLRGTGRIGLDERVEICRLSGGVSNRTMRVGRPSGEAWVVKQALTRLRVATEWVSDPRRIHREAAGLRCLAALAPPGTITTFVFEDFTHHLLAMGAVPQPHENWKAVLLSGRIERAHVEQFARMLATIHRRGAELSEALAVEFADCTFFESLRLEPYYAFAAQQVPEATPFLHALMEDCRARRFTLVHGDYSPKNVLVHQDRLVLLDHEVIHWGDGAFDVGFAMTHLLSKAHHLCARRKDLGDAARLFWDTYRAEAPGGPADLEVAAVQHTLACLLARVAGRSLLEYLNDVEQAQQRAIVVELMQSAPANMSRLVDSFMARL